MGLPKTKPGSMTEAEYLEFERAAVDQKHQYVDGEIFAMAGESGRHGFASANLSLSILTQLKGSSCRAFLKDMKVRSGPVTASRKGSRGMYSYPDFVVFCGEPEYLDDTEDVLLNPKAIFEVLSPSMELFDRNTKFDRYQMYNPTLTDYILVAQDRACLEHFQRVDGERWTYHRVLGRKGRVSIKSVGVTLKLAEVYDQVTFPKEK